MTKRDSPDSPNALVSLRVKGKATGSAFDTLLPRELAEQLQSGAHAFPLKKSLAEQAAAHGVLVVENFLDAETCRDLCDYVSRQTPQRSSLVNYDSKQEKMQKSYVDEKIRDTLNIPVQGINPQLRDIFYRAVADHIEPFFHLTIEWWEEPQLLCYTKGGKYEPHVDADYWVKKPDGTGGWKKIQDRDVSFLLYLNGEFTGGSLHFPDFKFKIQPAPGLLVAFPSGAEFRHGAEPTKSGTRLVLVSWASAEGVAKVAPQPPKYPVVYRKEFQ